MEKLFWKFYCLFFLLTLTSLAQSKSSFEPQRTWVCMIGVLEWADANSFASFEKKGRVDAKIIQFFQKQGVPSEQILYLKDQQATTKAIRAAMAPFLRQAKPNDVLFFYYCGHGYKNDTKKVCFASYQGTDWSAEEMVRTVNENFAGNTAFFTADCCNSGGLSQEVRKFPQRNYVALNSVVPTNVSTGNWTFSNALLYGLKGESFVDIDQNGKITLGELANYIDEEMAIVEGQKAAYFVPETLRTWAISSNVSPKKDKRIGQRVQVDYDGTDWLGFVVDSDAGKKFNVRFYSYTNNETDWVASSRLKPFVCPKSYPVGSSVEVYYADDKKWYPAKVLKTYSCLHYIHYNDYGSEWDEWVAPSNIRAKK